MAASTPSPSWARISSSGGDHSGVGWRFQSVWTAARLEAQTDFDGDTWLNARLDATWNLASDWSVLVRGALPLTEQRRYEWRSGLALELRL